MRPENHNGNSGAVSLTEHTVNDLHKLKRSKISYTRDALISLANLSKSPPEGFHSSISCESEDAANLHSGVYVTDSTSCRCSLGHFYQNSVHDGILGKVDSVKVVGNSVPEAQTKSDHLLHKSDDPYRLPHSYKALESKNLKACKRSNIGYSDGIHHLESEELYKLAHTLRKSSGGTSENCPSWREPLEKGTADEWQSLAALVTGCVRSYRERELETYVYPTWMFGNGSKSPGFIRDNSLTIPASSSITRNPTGSDIGIEKGLKLSHDSRSNHGSDLGVELSLPDEDSLHTFDDTYFVPYKEEGIGYEDFDDSSVRNLIRDKSSGSSLPIVESVPDDMAEKVAEHVLKDDTPCSPFDLDETSALSLDLDEKLVESVLDDESHSPTIDFDELVDSIVDETPTPLHPLHSPFPTNFCGDVEWLSSYQKLHMARSYPQFHQMQLNPRREAFHSPSHDQVHVSTQGKSPYTETDPIPRRPSLLFPPSMNSHPLHLLDGKHRRFECKNDHQLLHAVPTGETFPSSLHQRGQIEAPPHLSTLFPMAGYERELSPLQTFTAYQQRNYWVSPMASPVSGVHAYDYNYSNRRAAVDGLLNMRLGGMHIDT